MGSISFDRFTAIFLRFYLYGSTMAFSWLTANGWFRTQGAASRLVNLLCPTAVAICFLIALIYAFLGRRTQRWPLLAIIPPLLYLTLYWYHHVLFLMHHGL